MRETRWVREWLREREGEIERGWLKGSERKGEMDENKRRDMDGEKPRLKEEKKVFDRASERRECECDREVVDVT
jgi:hypothetical protein